MDNEDLKKAVEGWLEKQGYPLEMRASKIFSELGFVLRQGWYFQDPEEEKPREIDILASLDSYGGHPLVLSAIIECKWSEKPFIVFSYSNRSLPQITPEYLQSSPIGKEYIKKLSEKSLLDKLPLFSKRFGPLGYSMTQTQISIKGKDNNPVQRSKKDAAFDALIKVSKATFNIVEYEKSAIVRRENDPKDYVLAYIALPTIVIDAPLFDCYLNEKNEFVINQVPMAFINWSYPKVGNIPIRVYTISELSNFAEEIFNTRFLLEEQKIFL